VRVARIDRGAPHSIVGMNDLEFPSCSGVGTTALARIVVGGVKETLERPKLRLDAGAPQNGDEDLQGRRVSNVS
jgi:hypothetical protein